MTRRLAIDEVAQAELEEAQESVAARSPEKGLLFDEQVLETFGFLTEYPFSKAVSKRRGELELRQARIGRSAFFFFYLVYPSVDFQTGEALDVVYILACRHERQSEPNWGARDPFGTP